MNFLIPKSVNLIGSKSQQNHFAWFINQLVIQAWNFDCYGDFVNFQSSRLSAYMGCGYRVSINKLIEDGIVEANEKYKVGEFAKSYRLAPAHWDKQLVNYESPITHSVKIKRKMLDRSSQVVKFNKPAKTNWHNLNQLKFNAPENPNEEDEAWIKWVSNGNLSYSICEQGRHYHYVAQMPSRLRQYLTLEGEDLVICDYRHSQPSLHAILYGEADSPEKERFINLCKTGQLWNTLNNQMSYPFDLSNPARKREFKELAFKSLFYCGKNKKRNEFSNWFSNQFPILWEKMQKIKEGGTGALPKMMMTLEAEIIYNHVMTEDCFCVSIHDAILTTARNAAQIKYNMQEAFYNKVGFYPVVEVTHLNSKLEVAA